MRTFFFEGTRVYENILQDIVGDNFYSRKASRLSFLRYIYIYIIRSMQYIYVYCIFLILRKICQYGWRAHFPHTFVEATKKIDSDERGTWHKETRDVLQNMYLSIEGHLMSLTREKCRYETHRITWASLLKVCKYVKYFLLVLIYIYACECNSVAIPCPYIQ